MPEETKAQPTTKSKTPRLANDVEGFTKGMPVTVIKTYEDTGHHRIRVHLGNDEVSPDLVVGPDDIS